MPRIFLLCTVYLHMCIFSQLRQRALLLETTLSCMTKFDDIEKLLSSLDPAPRRALGGELGLPANEIVLFLPREGRCVRGGTQVFF